MLRIFAIDPETCSNLEWFRYCIEHCHPSKGRVIADLPPGSWIEIAKPIFDQLIENEKLPPVKRSRLKNSMDKKIRDQLADRPDTSWNYFDSSWITQAETEHRRECFSAIVSPEYDEVADNESRKYHPSQLDIELEHWNTPSGIEIKRSPGEFVKAILPMLRVSNKIHFIDRFFNVDDDSLFTKNYQEIIKDLAQCRNTKYYPFPELTIHCCPDESEKIKEEALKKLYSGVIPTGETVKVLVWQIKEKEKITRGNHPFHNRFVLSKHCGVMVGYGTDSLKEKTDATDVLQIIDHGTYSDLWEQIQDDNFPMLYIEDEFKIVGTYKSK